MPNFECVDAVVVREQTTEAPRPMFSAGDLTAP
jgi:hypothetical protein